MAEDSGILDKARKVSKEASGAYVSSSMDLAGSAADFFATLRPQFYGSIIKRILNGEDPEKVYKEALDQYKTAISGQKENVGKLTDLPVAAPGKELPPDTVKNIRLAGSGASGAVTLPAAVVGAISNVLADKVAPESEAGKFFVNLFLNVGIPGAVSGLRHIISGGAAEPLPKPADNIRMTRGEQTSSSKLLTQQNILSRSESQADKVAAWEQARAKDATESMTGFLGKPFDTALAEHKALGEAQYGAAHKLSGNQKFIRATNFRLALAKLVKENDVTAGTSTQKAKAAALKNLQADIQANPNLTTFEVQKLLQAYGKAAYGKGQLFNDVNPGDAVGEAKTLGGALQKDLEVAAASKVLKPQLAKSAELLLDANEQFKARLAPLRAYQNWTEAAKNYKASAMEPSENLSNLLGTIRKDLNDHPDLLERLYPNDKPAQELFKTKLEQLSKTVSDASVERSGHATELAASGAFQAASGVPGAGRGFMGAYEGAKMALKNKDVVFDYLFNPKYKDDSVLGKVLQSAPVRYPAKILERGTNMEVSNAVPQAVLNAPSTTPDIMEQYSPDKLFPDAVPNEPGQEVVEPDQQSSASDNLWQYSPNAVLARKLQSVESNDKAYAINPQSGARGASQFIPDTARAYGLKDPYDKEESLKATTKMLDDLEKEHGGDLDKMLAGYNWGSGNIKKYGMDKMPKETRDYIAKVRKLLEAEDNLKTEIKVLSVHDQP